MALNGSLRAASTAFPLLLFVASLFHAWPEREGVLLSVGKIVFIILKIKTLDIEHAPSISFCFLSYFHFLFSRHDTYTWYNFANLTYALLIIRRCFEHLYQFSRLPKSGPDRGSSRSPLPLQALFVYYFLNRTCCRRLWLANPVQVTALIPLPTWTFFENYRCLWCHIQSKLLQMFGDES